MSDVDEVLQAAHRIDPLVEFVPDANLDALFRQAVAVAKEYGWQCPTRADFEARYRQEIAASRKNK